jgi:Uncharacterised conserved protein (DUF2368)
LEIHTKITKMGISFSKSKAPSFQDQIKATVEEEIAKRMMKQREINMALNIAKARDMLQIFGSLYVVNVIGLGIAKIAGKPVPNLVVLPVLGSGVLLGNLFDMAYGNKMGRVCKEAEYILEHERPRFVPFKQVS